MLLPWRRLIVIPSTVFIATRDQMLPSPPRPHISTSGGAKLITMVVPIGPCMSAAHVFNNLYVEVTQFLFALPLPLDEILPLRSVLFLQNLLLISVTLSRHSQLQRLLQLFGTQLMIKLSSVDVQTRRWPSEDPSGDDEHQNKMINTQFIEIELAGRCDTNSQQ